MLLNSDTLARAHKHCFRNRAEILASELCGCFSCRRIFPPGEISTWTDLQEQPLFRNNVLVPLQNNEATAICPNCFVEAVIGSKSGYPIDDEFLMAMYERWFGKPE